MYYNDFSSLVIVCWLPFSELHSLCCSNTVKMPNYLPEVVPTSLKAEIGGTGVTLNLSFYHLCNSSRESGGKAHMRDYMGRK